VSPWTATRVLDAAEAAFEPCHACCSCAPPAAPGRPGTGDGDVSTTDGDLHDNNKEPPLARWTGVMCTVCIFAVEAAETRRCSRTEEGVTSLADPVGTSIEPPSTEAPAAGPAASPCASRPARPTLEVRARIGDVRASVILSVPDSAHGRIEKVALATAAAVTFPPRPRPEPGGRSSWDIVVESRLANRKRS